MVVVVSTETCVSNTGNGDGDGDGKVDMGQIIMKGVKETALTCRDNCQRRQTKYLSSAKVNHVLDLHEPLSTLW